MAATKTTNKLLKTLEAAIRAAGTPQVWEVKSVTKFPTFAGEATEKVERSHGGYTTDEAFKPSYLLNGWIEAGYQIKTWEKEDEGLFIVHLTQFTIDTWITLRQYAC